MLRLPHFILSGYLWVDMELLVADALAGYSFLVCLWLRGVEGDLAVVERREVELVHLIVGTIGINRVNCLDFNRRLQHWSCTRLPGGTIV